MNDEDYGQSWDDYPNYDEDEAYFEDEENYDDAAPSDLENAGDLTGEAFVNYTESRRGMKEIALRTAAATPSWRWDQKKCMAKDVVKDADKKDVAKARLRKARAKARAIL